MVIRDVCPQCKSPKSKKNGHIHNGKQHHQCKDCGRQFVDGFAQDLVSDETRGLIERLLLERLSLRGICRAVGVGRTWLLGFIVTQCEALPDHLNVEPITRNADIVIQRLEVEADAMASCVQKKANKPWIWLAMDAKSRQIIGLHVGDRRRKSARKLWANMPTASRRLATFYPDQYVVYVGVIPAAQHQPIGKLARKTHHIERFNNTLRQRVSRLVRSALSFSKTLANHIGAIKYFICNYNLLKAKA